MLDDFNAGKMLATPRLILEIGNVRIGSDDRSIGNNIRRCRHRS